MTWKIVTAASTRSGARREKHHRIEQGMEYRDITVETEDDARYVATRLHGETLGWCASIWIRSVEAA